jgi:SAM-dependent methyltransferase
MKNEATLQSSDISLALESWYARHSGSELLATYRAQLRPILDLAFGYHILQTGPMAGHNLIVDSPISHHMVASDSSVGGPSLLCHGDELPFESDSMDMVLGFHALEFSAHPHACLREMQRVLRPRGHLVILGFNPNSLPGLWRRMRGLRRDSLWARHHPVSLHRLTDWLHLVDCELESVRHLYPLPLSGEGRLRRTVSAFDGWAMRHRLPGGSLYIAHALKQIPGARRPRPVAALPRKRLIGLAVAGRPTPAPRSPRKAAPRRAA